MWGNYPLNFWPTLLGLMVGFWVGNAISTAAGFHGLAHWLVVIAAAVAGQGLGLLLVTMWRRRRDRQAREHDPTLEREDPLGQRSEGWADRS